MSRKPIYVLLTFRNRCRLSECYRDISQAYVMLTRVTVRGVKDTYEKPHALFECIYIFYDDVRECYASLLKDFVFCFFVFCLKTQKVSKATHEYIYIYIIWLTPTIFG